MLPQGFALIPGWLIPSVSDTAVADIEQAIPWRHETIKMFGREVMQPRLTSWMGDAPYTYSGRRHDPAPTPAIVRMLQAEAEAIANKHFNSVLANQYRDGQDSVAWHSDDEPELGAEPTIASLSLGASRNFKIKRKSDGKVWTITLGHGDLLVMSGASQRDYLHSVPKTKRVCGERINLTFRHIAA